MTTSRSHVANALRIFHYVCHAHIYLIPIMPFVTVHHSGSCFHFILLTMYIAVIVSKVFCVVSGIVFSCL